MSVPFRLPDGGLIDRSAALRFSFDGMDMIGQAGDTLASALLANGIRLVARSFKYHRPRGILSAGSEEPNALVELRSGARREPNTRATVAELFNGLIATSQNRWPSLGFDVGAVNNLVSPVLVAGFYYKTFMWPAPLWEKLYEPAIRRAAGLGKAAAVPDPDHYEKSFAHCDLLVIGAGPAGLMAALTAGRAGARVILCDEDFQLGGRANAEQDEIDGQPAQRWVRQAEAELIAMPDVRIMRRTTVFGVYDHGTYGAVERVSDHLAEPRPHQPRQRAWRIIAKRSILAAGAIERPLVFGGNDRPGVMMAGAVRTYMNRYAVAPGKRLVVFTAGDDGWRTARDAVAAGLHVDALVDTRREAGDAALVAKLAAAGTRIVLGGQVIATEGGKVLSGVTIRDAAGREIKAEADCLAVSNGWSPAVHLTCHLGGKPVWNEEKSAFLPGALPPGMRVVGAASGALTLGAVLREGVAAAQASLGEIGFPAANASVPEAFDEPAAVSPVWHVADSRGKAFVDYQHDVTTKDITLSAQEGFRSVEHMKRYTTLGMATDQGKISNVNGLALLAEARGQSIAEVGTTVFRPPYTPVTIGALAGHHKGKEFRPTRLTASHGWAAENGASFVESGAWLRAEWYTKPGETSWLQSCNREVMATRNGVGVCDVSTLGKIDIQGRDAGAFLDRVYTNTFSTLAIGKARYGLMLREDGFVMDDGTTSRLAENHFLMTTTTANAVKIMAHLEFCHQVLWPELDVAMVSVTEQWSQYSIAGPQSRALLQKVVDGQHDISNGAFPYMAAGAVTVCGGVPGRLFRISFSGELAYEIGVPARYGDALIRALMEAGKEFGLTPYGTEALNVMRIEKGHAAGSELSGQTTARDLGLAKMMSTKKDYIGRVMVDRPALTDPDRPILVGFKPVVAHEKLTSGAHFIAVGAATTMANDEGYMTSVCYSPTLGHSIGLGLLKRGRDRIGERVRAVDSVRSKDIEVEICDPVFHDPAGEKLRG